MKKGFVALVGAGPGEVGLLTLRGKELLEAAEVVVYDRLVSEQIKNLIPKQARRIDVGKESSNHLVSQDKINELLLEEARNGSFVVRLKGGDPYVFGRGGEELKLLHQNEIPYEVVPGITSAIAAPAYAGIPVTHRDYCSSLHIITGHQKENEPLKINFDSLVHLEGTLVFLMGVAALKQIAEGLMKAGMEPHMPAAVIQNGTRSNQRKLIADLKSIYEKAVEEKIKSPAVIVVGKVCTLSDRYDWFMNKPLFGATVIVTRPAASEGSLLRKLRGLGAEVYDYPCIKIEEIEAKNRLEEAVSRLKSFSWFVFTSKNGVTIFFEYLKKQKLDCRILSNIKIAAIGSQTALELEKYGIFADYVPETFDGVHLGNGLVERTRAGEQILILRARKGNEELINLLRENNREYIDIPIYDTIHIKAYAQEITMLLSENKTIYAAFTSASTVEGFMENIGNHDRSNILGICIGEQTAKAAEKYKLNYVISKSATIDSMVEKLLEVQDERNQTKKN